MASGNSSWIPWRGQVKREVTVLMGSLILLTTFPLCAEESQLRNQQSEATNQFREIVFRLSQDGDFLRAASELGVLEGRWDDAGFFSTLEESEREFTEYLGDRSSQAVYPLAELFSITHVYHLETGHSRLARHAIRRVVFSGRLYRPGRQTLQEIGIHGEGAKSFEKPAVLSRNLSRIGLFLMQGNYLDEAIEGFLLPAARVDPSSTIPLHLLAAIHEKRNLYPEAIENLDVLLSISPKDAHGRLRRGMVLARMGEPEAALEELDLLLQDESPVPVKLVAIQEAVGLYVEAHARDRTIELLRKSLQQFPSEQSLRTLQLWLLPGETSQAISVLGAAEAKKPMSVDIEERTPRVAYNNWPREELEELWAKRSEDLQSSLRDLRTLLGPEVSQNSCVELGCLNRRLVCAADVSI